MFQHLGSAPVTFLDNEFLDAITLFEAAQTASGKPSPPQEQRIIEQSDAQQAYTQSPLGGTETWVYLPPNRWPKSWKGKFHRPVCKLLRALYGHADAGGYWAKKCDQHLLSVGFTKVPNWPSWYLHAEYRLFLTRYVDDFKMSGTKTNLQKGWQLIKQGINIDDPTPLKRYLGCEHMLGTAVFDASKFPLSQLTQVHQGLVGPFEQAARNVYASTGVTSTAHSFDMPVFGQWPIYTSVFDAHVAPCQARGKPSPPAAVSLSYQKRRSQPEQVEATSVPVRVMEYDMRDFLQQCVDQCLELAAPHVTKLQKVGTPFCSDAQLAPLYDIPGEDK